MTKITKEQVLENLEDVKKYVNEAESEVEGMAIKNRWTEDTIFQSTKTTWKEAVEEAVENGADLHDANLREADLRGADLYGADLREANLRYADLRGADLLYALLGGADLYFADLRHADLYGADLPDADFNGADLREANLYEANLDGAELMNAKFHGRGGTSKLTKKQLPVFLNSLGFQVEN